MEIMLAVIVTGIITAIAVLWLKNFKKSAGQDGENKLILDYIEALRKDFRDSHASNRQETKLLLDRMDDRLSKGIQNSAETIQKQFSQSAKMIKEVTEELTNLKGTNKQVLDFTAQMHSLENILKNPKQRGILGEYFLEALLSKVLAPGQYKMQYKFSDGDIVDAVVFFKDKIIPIDAKFSLEKYNKIAEETHEARREQLEKDFKTDIKNRIDETSKYIRQKENTTDFAFMFIPAEGIYYNLLIYKVGNLNVNSSDLIEYAFAKHVIIVSPTSFFAYLQTVLQGLKAVKMEESIKEVIKNIDGLGKHISAYEIYIQKLGNNLGTTVNMYNSAYKEFAKINKDIYKVTDGTSGGAVNPLLIEKPNVEV
ncbi:MAG: DNA recombination protein RmuC [Candidatus Gracilibacteria bacterium]